MGRKAIMETISWENFEEIIDRDEESDQILQDIKKNIHTKVNFIYSKTAKGKSCLATKIYNQYDGVNYIPIRVKTVPNNDNKDNAWEFLEDIFIAFSDYFEINDYIYSFDYYLTNFKDPEINEKCLSSSLDELTKLNTNIGFFRSIFHLTIKRELKLNEFSVLKYKNDITFDGRRIKSNYIKYVFSKKSIFLMIDNIQNIDNYSLKCIKEWLSISNGRPQYLLLEYTINEINENRLDTLIEVFIPFAVVIKTKVPDLQSRYITDLISKRIKRIPNDINFNVNVLKHYSKESKGNIKEIIDYSLRYQENNLCIDTENGTYKNIKLVPEPECKFILAIIILHSGRIPIDILNKVISYPINIEEKLLELSKSKLINVLNQVIELNHPTIKEQWVQHKDEFLEFDDMGYNALKKYYLGAFESDDIEIQNEAWRQLLKLYSQREPFQIKTLLEHLENKIAVLVTPEDAYKYIQDVFECINSETNEYERICFRLLEISYRLELYKEGEKLLLEIEKQNDIHNKNLLFIHKLLYFAANDKHEKVIYLYENMKNSIHSFSRTELNAMLSVLCSYRYIGRIDECLKLHKHIIKNKVYKNYPEYAYFLRLTNIYLPNKKAIRYSRKSIKQFNKQHNKLQEGKSLITYSKLLAGLGNLEKGIRFLNKAEKLLKDFNLRGNVLWVDKASMLMMQGIHDNSVWELLCKSEFTAATSYDRLAIVIVKLAWCYENKDFNLAELISFGEKLVLLEPDLHIHALFYYNVYSLYELMGDKVASSKYHKKVQDLKEYNKYIKARFDGAKTKEEKERLKNPWYICYLSFWNHDIEFYED